MEKRQRLGVAAERLVSLAAFWRMDCSRASPIRQRRGRWMNYVRRRGHETRTGGARHRRRGVSHPVGGRGSPFSRVLTKPVQWAPPEAAHRHEGFSLDVVAAVPRSAFFLSSTGRHNGRRRYRREDPFGKSRFSEQSPPPPKKTPTPSEKFDKIATPFINNITKTITVKITALFVGELIVFPKSDRSTQSSAVKFGWPWKNGTSSFQFVDEFFSPSSSLILVPGHVFLYLNASKLANTNMEMLSSCLIKIISEREVNTPLAKTGH